jgi:hypothetical protein
VPNSADEVAAGAPNPQSYSDNGDGTVTDNVTKLMWQQAVPATTYGWKDSIAYCPTLTLADYHDWRLPTVIELISIVDHGKATPATDATYFPATPAARFWTSTAYSRNSDYAHWVSFGDGQTQEAVVSTLYNVRCVR